MALECSSAMRLDEYYYTGIGWHVKRIGRELNFNYVYTTAMMHSNEMTARMRRVLNTKNASYMDVVPSPT